MIFRPDNTIFSSWRKLTASRAPQRGRQLRLCALVLAIFQLCAIKVSWGMFPCPPLNGVEDRAVSLWDDPHVQALSVAGSLVPALTLKTKGLKRDVTVDPEKRIIIYEETLYGLRLKTPLIYDLDTFIQVRTSEGLPRLLRKQWTEGISDAEKKGSGRGGINIDIPVKFPKALTRIIGEGGGLRITGYRKISFSGRSEWTEGDVLTATHRPSKFPALVMEQRSQFKIEGTIGEKIHVYVDQDSERMTELENAIRINYEGFEDEIIQEIQAGNTSLSLPQTQFVSFSQKNTGLFGIKTTAKIGPFDLVAIASQDKGAGQRKSFQAGAESKARHIEDYDYRTGYYYFLDTDYVNNYEWYTDNWVHRYDSQIAIDSIEVFIDDNIVGNNAEEGARFAYAYVDPNDTTFVSSEREEGYFRLLDLDEYYVNKEMGYIVLNTHLRDQSILAVTYKLLKDKDIPRELGGWVGNYNPDPTDTTAVNILKLIRPKHPRPGLETWALEWKNVYYLGSSNIPEEGLDISIYLDKSGQEDDDSQGDAKFVSIMGLDKFDNQVQSDVGSDGVFDVFDGTIVNLVRGELIFPTLRPFDTDFPFEGRTLIARVPQLYDTTDVHRKQFTKYYIAVESQSREASYSLGINIIEGSEVVKLNGRPLQRNKDYNIIYEIGQITFLTDEALDPTADISVDYEFAPFFMPERKTLLGMRGEYSFWEDAHWGATVLYRSESMPLDRRIRLGQEPTRAMVWESDLHLDFEPQILTDMVDAFPLVRTNVPSALKISGEVAQSLPNSNTKGEAYVDDFDGSKNTTSLGVIRGQWTLASPPDGEHSIDNRGKEFFYYNPFEQVDVREIWPKREAYAREGRTHVLAFRFTPSDTGSWAGVMRALSQGNFDQSRSKYIELWVNGNSGRINVDLGLIHEDVIPNRKLDSEDEGADVGRGDNLLDLDEDIGLDGMAGVDPSDWWDLNGDGVKDPGEPTSNDDWSYQSGSSSYAQINGTEGNRNDPDRGIRPDTEDLNGNGLLDTENKFFRYSFSLSPNDPDNMYVAGDNGKEWDDGDSWRLYRIPLAEPKGEIGEPDMTNIQFVRIWITGVDKETKVKFATIDIVGNDWLEDGIDVGSGQPFIGEDETFSVTVKNTHDNPTNYDSPPGIAGVIDPVTNLRQMEQSLVVTFENLAGGHSGSASQVFLGTARDFTTYRTLRMFVYGDIESSAGSDTGVAQFFFRFGADTANYYEYRAMIYPDNVEGTIYWDPRNEVHIDFDELTNLKYQKLKGEGAEGDTSAGKYRIHGSPSLSDIRRLTVGVKSIAFPNALKHDGTMPPRWETISGEVWVDELRLTHPRDDPGLAGRVTVDAKLADLGAIKFNMSKVDAEFQSLGAGSRSDAQKSSKSDESIQGNINVDKFLPEKWGFSLPFSASYSKTVQLPKLRKGSDVNLNEDEQWEQRTQQTSKSGRISFSKKASSFWLLGLTLDRMKFSFSGSEKGGRSTTNPYSLNQQMSGTFSYDLAVKKNLFLSPLGWTSSKFVPKFISGTKITVIPSNVSFDTNINETKSDTEDRHGNMTHKSTRTTSQKFSGTLKPFGSVSTNFSLNRKIDSQGAGWKTRLTTLKFGREIDRTQSLSLTYKPPFLSWLGPNYSYRANYHEKENSKVDPTKIDSLSTRKFGLDVDNSISHSVNASLNPSQLLVSLGAPKKGDKAGLLSPRWILGMVRTVTDRFQSVSGSFQKDNRSSWFNLVERPPLGYQFGLESDIDTTVVRMDPTLTGHPPTKSSGQSWSAKSGLNLIAGVSVSTSISSDFKSNITSTGQTDSRTFTFPQVSTRWGDFGKLFLIKKLVSSSSLDFSYTEKETKEGTDNLNVLYSRSTSKNFSPLFSWSASWAKNLSSTVSKNRSYTETINRRQSTVTTQTTSSLVASVKYSFNAPQGIKLPGLGKVKFESNLNLNLDLKLNDSKNETKNVPNPITKWDKTTSVTLGGSYSFSKKVKGGLKVEISNRHDKKTERKTKVRDVGLWTEIRFD